MLLTRQIPVIRQRRLHVTRLSQETWRALRFPR